MECDKYSDLLFRTSFLYFNLLTKLKKLHFGFSQLKSGGKIPNALPAYFDKHPCTLFVKGSAEIIAVIGKPNFILWAFQTFRSH